MEPARVGRSRCASNGARPLPCLIGQPRTFLNRKKRSIISESFEECARHKSISSHFQNRRCHHRWKDIDETIKPDTSHPRGQKSETKDGDTGQESLSPVAIGPMPRISVSEVLTQVLYTSVGKLLHAPPRRCCAVSTVIHLPVQHSLLLLRTRKA